MAKRSSKSRRKSSQERRAASADAAVSAQAETSKKTDLAAEYQYVVVDLKRIGVIAAVLVAVLVVLSFFL